MADLTPGTELGPYVIAGLLGGGTMGEVYRAHDRRLDRQVAIKVLAAELVSHSDRLRRFEDEARATGRLNHPNIIAIYDVGHDHGCRYLVSELLEGENLRQRMAGEALPRRKAIELASQIARGLAAAHDRGIVHRDLKPENVFVTTDGVVKILDFGVAKLTEREPSAGGVEDQGDARLVGTVAYMSPEQVLGDPVDHRSDIFSFGTLLYEMVTGFRPFSRDSLVETMTAITRVDPLDLSVSGVDEPELDRLLKRCLEKRPEDRFQSTRDLGFALAGLGASTVTSGQPLWLPPYPEPAPRRRLVGLGLLVAAVVASAALVIGRWPSSEVPSFQLLTFRRGQVTAARFAPDGSSVVYSAAWAGAPEELFTTRLDVVRARSLGLPWARLVTTRPGELAFLRVPRSGASEAGTLARVGLDGGTPRELLEDVVDAAWDSDGTTLAVARTSDGRCRLEWPLGTEIYVSAGTIDGVRLSPDDGRVAFIDHPLVGDTRGSVVVADGTGRILARSEDWADAEGLAWAPDGGEVWFGAARSGASRALWALDRDGGVRIVSRVAGRLTLQDIAPDGRVLASHSHWRFEAMAKLPGEERERSVSWLDGTLLADLSADGSLLLFTEGGEGGGPAFSVWLRRIDGPQPVRLGNGQAMDLSPDGRWALALEEKAPHQALLLPTGPGTTLRLPLGRLTGLRWAYWLPDGDAVLVVGHEADRPDRVWTQSVPDGEPVPLTPEGTRTTAWLNTVSPDGSLVPVVAVGGDDTYTLYPIAGGNPRTIPGILPGDEPLGFSADGADLFVRRGGSEGSFQVVRLNLASGGVTPWRELGPVDRAGVSTRFSTVLLAADGDGYAYYFRRELSELYLIEGLR